MESSFSGPCCLPFFVLLREVWSCPGSLELDWAVFRYRILSTLGISDTSTLAVLMLRGVGLVLCFRGRLVDMPKCMSIISTLSDRLEEKKIYIRTQRSKFCYWNKCFGSHSNCMYLSGGKIIDKVYALLVVVFCFLSFLTYLVLFGATSCFIELRLGSLCSLFAKHAQFGFFFSNIPV